MSRNIPTLSQALDLAIFGPIGMALSAVEDLPKWVERGRHQMARQFETARLVGEHAARHGRATLTSQLVGFGLLPGPRPPDAPRAAARPSRTAEAPDAPSTSASSSSDDADDRSAVAPLSPPSRDNGRKMGRNAPAPMAVAELAIPGYDSLSAFQVVQRLASLAPPELEAVRSYEESGRGRRTILTKISQLQSGRH